MNSMCHSINANKVPKLFLLGYKRPHLTLNMLDKIHLWHRDTKNVGLIAKIYYSELFSNIVPIHN
ncbi:hypothetical protein BLOT_015933 [Blomia tropicalis]|nr:hypothetical protein BLOT_015933 [Blomia tropicalis]